ncbi:hypothetical protein Q1695_007917 [Nippostrongylus brasiliensis]|nr:hypothetical protein Q1695_007917 [Nippostrongylus brasiliensis]
MECFNHGSNAIGVNMGEVQPRYLSFSRDVVVLVRIGKQYTSCVSVCTLPGMDEVLIFHQELIVANTT